MNPRDLLASVGWRIGASVLVVALAAAVLAVAGSQIGLLLLAVAVQLGLLLYVRRLGARLVHRLERTERRATDGEAASQTRDDALADQLTTVASTASGLAQDLDAVRKELPGLATRLDGLSDELATSSSQALSRRDLRFALRRTYDQVDALQALYHDLQPLHAFPPMGTWAASPDLLRFLLATITREKPGLVVECGSGVSTLVMAYALERNDGGRVIALEHLEEHHDATSHLVERHGLAHRVDVRLAPLRDVVIDGETYPWYDTAALPSEPVDLLLVDGPPGKEHPHARLPALPLLHDLLAPGALVVLDDHRRTEEQEVVARWLERYPSFTCDEVKHEKGTAVLTRPSPDRSD